MRSRRNSPDSGDSPHCSATIPRRSRHCNNSAPWRLRELTCSNRGGDEVVALLRQRLAARLVDTAPEKESRQRECVLKLCGRGRPFGCLRSFGAEKRRKRKE